MTLQEVRLAGLKAFVEKPIEVYESIIHEVVVTDIHVLDECYTRCEKTLEKEFVQEDLSHFKFAGAICFWIRKLKPFKLKNPSTPHSTYVNEHLAFSIAYIFLVGALKEKKDYMPPIKAAFLADFVTFLRYNSASPHALILMFMALALDE